ncbi:hypothetical protein [uncultured Helicobacter sp.]|uniref:hypothetical protein n=1 Tax=uncultured Helicobacter sp. TaxID=175537 RepID=UPI003753CE8C
MQVCFTNLIPLVGSESPLHSAARTYTAFFSEILESLVPPRQARDLAMAQIL